MSRFHSFEKDRTSSKCCKLATSKAEKVTGDQKKFRLIREVYEGRASELG